MVIRKEQYTVIRGTVHSSNRRRTTLIVYRPCCRYLAYIFPPFWGGGNESLVTEAISGLLFQPRLMISVEHSVEFLSGEIEVKVKEKNYPHNRPWRPIGL
jgi:hypothetical protein